ncbi:activating transcription factor 7-interacting protein 2 isoform X2 [Ambystoma mexicanum]|uniref:activating transcription factor 7-interacting protein 2 isoform X2 n=1 Tax=Ambystoma mexicanum TaxID=8296 RepID=UPI0037E7B7F2
MEPSTEKRKIFRARKTMNPSSRPQIESLNKLRDVWQKERTLNETATESIILPSNNSDVPIKKNRSGAENKCETYTQLSEEKEISPSKLKVSEVLGIECSTNVCSTKKDECPSNHNTADRLDPLEVKHHDMEKLHLSKEPVGNPQIENIVNEMCEEGSCGALSEDHAGDNTTKLQDSLSQRLHDMLVQEKKIIATTAPCVLENNRDGESVTSSDNFLPILEKIVIPLNLSEGDEDEGLPMLERMNEKVDREDAKQTDCVINVLQDLKPISHTESPIISCSDQLLNHSTVVGELTSVVFSKSEMPDLACTDGTLPSPNESMAVDLNTEACVSPANKQMLDAEIPNITRGDETLTSPKESIEVDLKGEACVSLANKHILDSDIPIVTCVNEKLTSKESMGVDLKSEASVSLANKNILNAEIPTIARGDEKLTSPKETMAAVDLACVSLANNILHAEIPNITRGDEKLTSTKESMLVDLKSEACVSLANKQMLDDEIPNITRGDEKLTSPKELMEVDLESEACVSLANKQILDAEIPNITSGDEKLTSPKELMEVDLESEACVSLADKQILDPEIPNITRGDEKLTSPKESMEVDLKSEACVSLANKQMLDADIPVVTCVDEKLTSKESMAVDLKSEACVSLANKNILDAEIPNITRGDEKLTSPEESMAVDLKSETCVSLANNKNLDAEIPNITRGDEKLTSPEESMAVDLKSETCVSLANKKNVDAEIPNMTRGDEKLVSPKEFMDVDLKSETCVSLGNTFLNAEIPNLTCGDEKLTSPEESMAVDLKSETCVSIANKKNVDAEIPNMTRGDEKLTSPEESMAVDLKSETCVSLANKNILDAEIPNITHGDEKLASPKELMDVDLKTNACVPLSNKTLDADEKVTSCQDPLIGDLKREYFCASGNLSGLGAEATSRKDTVVDNFNSATVCKTLNETISRLGAEVASQSLLPPVECNIDRFPRKRLNSENDSALFKRFKHADEVSCVPEKNMEVSEKVKCLIDRQLQIFFADVFDQRLEKLTERVQQIQCGKKHEELVAKCLRKLRRFESHANIAVKSLKEVLRQHSVQPSTTKTTKDVAPVESIRNLKEELQTCKPVMVKTTVDCITAKSPMPVYFHLANPTHTSTVDVSTPAKQSLPVHHRASSPTTPRASASAATKPSGPWTLQSVTSIVSPTKMSVIKSESDCESLPGKAQLNSLSSIISDHPNRGGSTETVNVLNSKLDNKDLDERIKQSQMVIDLTEEECSSSRDMPFTDQDCAIKNEKAHFKEKQSMGKKNTLSLKNVSGCEIGALPNMVKLLQAKKYSHSSNLENVTASETVLISSTNLKDDHGTSSKLNPDFIGLYEKAAKPKSGISNYGDRMHQPNLESTSMGKTNTGLIATNSNNVQTTLQKRTLEKRTTVESTVKPTSALSNESRRSTHTTPVRSFGYNEAVAKSSYGKSQDRESSLANPVLYILHVL